MSYLRRWSDPRRSYEQNHQAIHPETSSRQEAKYQKCPKFKALFICNLTAKPHKNHLDKKLPFPGLVTGGDLP